MIYSSNLVGARRIFHDTYLYFLPYRIYLSDALHNGFFPFWNPFSYPGIPTAADMASGIYYPIAIILALLFRYDGSIFILEFVVTAAIACGGMYGWLKHNGVKSEQLMLLGAISFAGGLTTLDWLSAFSFVRTFAFLPILFWGIDLLVTGTRKTHFLLGVLLASIALWIMSLATYVGFTFVFFALLFALARLVEKGMLKQIEYRYLLGFGTLAVLITCALSFLPLSELLNHFAGDMDNLRPIGDIDPFRGCIPTVSPLSMFFSNSSYLKNHGYLIMAGNCQMYFGIILSTVLLVGVVRSVLRTKDYIFFSLGVIVLLAGMGPWSPVAQFMVAYVPGFAYFRWQET